MPSASSQLFSNLTSILLKISKLKELDEGPLQEVFLKICTAACLGLKIERSSIWFIDPLKTFITNQITCSSKGLIHNDALVIKEEQFPNYFKALLEERTIVANNALSHPTTIEFKDCYLIPLGITSMLDCPIRQHGKLIGILCCENIGPTKTWLQEEQSFAASLAEFVSHAMIANERNVAEEKLRSLGKS